MASDNPGPLHEHYLERPNYTFLHTVGVGNAGKSLLWVHEVLGRPVVSKTIDLLGLPGGIARSEPRLLESMDHAHLVRVREAQWAEGYDPSLKVVTFTTDYCEGRSVATALEEGHEFSVRESLTIVGHVLDALDYMHNDHRMVHRDVKPGNVMLDGARRQGFLGDLGSAALMKDDGTVPAGGCTPLYQAPESTEGRIDARADVYGAGMVLHEMLAGSPDFATMDYDRICDRLDEGRRAMPNSYFDLPPWVPDNVARLVRSMTHSDPDRRPADAAEALNRVQRTACVDWRRADGSGLTGRWEGNWPSSVPMARRRLLEVIAEPVTSGKFKGLVLLKAAHRTTTKPWRGYARLTRRVAPGDAAALAGFFREVEAAAQATPI
ncbi:Protein kinase domain-containing protein [Nocardioides exalbidus]|uniref:non-specific serine/threonine protein kinase n=1 Tax=Nocardioides exalbidus TaxID=402596 RepID=A0A1H4NXV2_9ACTN|nr:serine/threonine-protein kinase [Nocardioides exalbidus]SEB99979.1 Protein kinase domain-containing protein [Nocardioides exalbidus]